MRFIKDSMAASLRRMSVVLFMVAVNSFFLRAPAHGQGQSLMTRHVRSEVTGGQAKFLSRLPGMQTLRIDIVLPLRDQPGLDEFLQEVYDPTSPYYRHFLTVPEFTKRFGPSQEDYDALVAFAKSSGFKVLGGSREGMDVLLEGSVTSIEAAFNVTMGVYQHPTENRAFYASDREPTLPLPFPIWHISGLDNFSIPHPALMHRSVTTVSHATTGSGPDGSYLGSDMRAAYYGGTALTGANQTIGLLEFGGYDIDDLNTYYTVAGQTRTASVVGISADGTSLSCVYPSCDDTEQILDMTQALGMAPGISTLYVYVGILDTAILSSMTTQSPLPMQLSNSWGWDPADPAADDPYYKKMAAQGQSFFVAAGDNGAYTSGSTYVYPAEDAYITSVGGTDLQTTGPNGAWGSESAWPDGGGGYYTPDAIPIPSWQKPAITSANLGSMTYRNGPDVAAEANFDFLVCSDQSDCTANYYGGTSFAAPMWAGYMALVNQQAQLNGYAPLGFINPLIYQLGLGSNYAMDFHDITSGSNGYTAIAGYDLATGWGSPNGVGLINALAGPAPSPDFTISASPNSISVALGNNGTSTITTAVSGGFNAAISLSASGQPSGVTVSFNPSSLAAPGSGTSTMTMNVGSSTATGTYTITVTGSGGGITHTTTFNLTVTTVPNPSFAISASPTVLSVVQGSRGTSTIETAISGGFNSAISFSASGQPSSASVSFNPSSIAAPGSGTSKMTMSVASTTATGTYTITVTGRGGGITHTTTVTLTVAQANPDFSISASPTALTVPAGSSGSSTIATAAQGSFNSSISLSVSGVPSGVGVSLSPNPIAAPGSGASTLRISASSYSITGTFPLTIKGTGGGKSHSTTVTLTVN